ncbi:MAG: methylmalonyl-CoA epimerase [Elusimicrobia bacterium]|nr:methylmalonyl-CoA epimerase [Elusimicrobiota bacterium]
MDTEGGWNLRLDHIAFAVKDLEESSRFYRDVLGLKCSRPEAVPEQKVRLAFLELGEVKIELVEPSAPDSPIARFLETRGGKGGIHHVCLAVEDLDAEMERLRAKGAAFITERPRPGSRGSRVAFIHPKSSGGVLIELCERR